MSETKQLTPEQIKNWREVLCGMIGPYGLMMPPEEVNGSEIQCNHGSNPCRRRRSR